MTKRPPLVCIEAAADAAGVATAVAAPGVPGEANRYSFRPCGVRTWTK